MFDGNASKIQTQFSIHLCRNQFPTLNTSKTCNFTLLDINQNGKFHWRMSRRYEREQDIIKNSFSVASNAIFTFPCLWICFRIIRAIKKHRKSTWSLHFNGKSCSWDKNHKLKILLLFEMIKEWPLERWKLL